MGYIRDAWPSQRGADVEDRSLDAGERVDHVVGDAILPTYVKDVYFHFCFCYLFLEKKKYYSHV